MAEQLWQALSGLPAWLVVVLLSAAPVSEVRGGIPVGLLAYQMPLVALLPLAIAANVVAVAWVVPTYNWMAATFDRVPLLGAIFRFFTRRAEKNRRLVERFGVFGLTLFVAIPLPVTGAWTGSVIAAVFRMPFWRSMLCVTLGVTISSIVVTILSLAGIELFAAIRPAS